MVDVMIVKGVYGVVNILSHKDFRELLEERLGTDAAAYFDRECADTEWAIGLMDRLRSINARDISRAKLEEELDAMYEEIAGRMT